MKKHSNNYVPSYLLPPQFCYTTTLIAIFISSLSLITMATLANMWSSTILQAELAQNIVIALEISFLLCCTLAIWKKAIKT